MPIRFICAGTLRQTDPGADSRRSSHQIISWIDEAILIALLPEQWQSLEKEGFTGAIDLAWLAEASTEEDELKKLSERLKMDDASILRDVVKRLASDAQLRLVWVLYQFIDNIDSQSEVEDSKEKK